MATIYVPRQQGQTWQTVLFYLLMHEKYNLKHGWNSSTVLYGPFDLISIIYANVQNPLCNLVAPWCMSSESDLKREREGTIQVKVDRWSQLLTQSTHQLWWHWVTAELTIGLFRSTTTQNYKLIVIAIQTANQLKNADCKAVDTEMDGHLWKQWSHITTTACWRSILVTANMCVADLTITYWEGSTAVIYEPITSVTISVRGGLIYWKYWYIAARYWYIGIGTCRYRFFPIYRCIGDKWNIGNCLLFYHTF